MNLRPGLNIPGIIGVIHLIVALPALGITTLLAANFIALGRVRVVIIAYCLVLIPIIGALLAKKIRSPIGYIMLSLLGIATSLYIDINVIITLSKIRIYVNG